MAYVKDVQKQVIHPSINAINAKRLLPRALMVYVLNVQKKNMSVETIIQKLNLKDPKKISELFKNKRKSCYWFSGSA